MDKTKVILDTDIGSDIDDAVCLAYLLAQPRCDLLGVTTVTGEPVKRAQMASALCRVAGRSGVPIHPGCATPLLVEQRQPDSQQDRPARNRRRCRSRRLLQCLLRRVLRRCASVTAWYSIARQSSRRYAMKTKKGSLVQFFRESPLFGHGLDLRRSKEPARKVDL